MIVVATTEEGVGRVRARFDELGVHETSVSAPSGSRRLVLAAVDDERLAAALREDGEIAVVRPDDGARLEEWRRHTRPLVFGGRLSVSFAWSEHDRSDLPGLVELGLGGFGNGEHPTTRMLVEALVDRLVGGERVLDVGCGSGVLGLCALALGASSVVAVDRKAEAVEATRRNAALNGVDGRVEATTATLGELDGRFDVVLANVGRAAIIDLAPDLVRLTGPTGWLAVSGFSPPQCTQVGDLLRPMVEEVRLTSGEWSALVVTRAATAERRSQDT